MSKKYVYNVYDFEESEIDPVDSFYDINLAKELVKFNMVRDYKDDCFDYEDLKLMFTQINKGNSAYIERLKIRN